jgi:NAD(P)-dependent dehydrogenase (short-subunit alcohol dehydrogenase family)
VLHNQNAIVYGSAGSLGSAVARALAKAGAAVLVTGHKLNAVESLAADLIAAGYRAEAAEVDALEKGRSESA